MRHCVLQFSSPKGRFIAVMEHIPYGLLLDQMWSVSEANQQGLLNVAHEQLRRPRRVFEFISEGNPRTVRVILCSVKASLCFSLVSLCSDLPSCGQHIFFHVVEGVRFRRICVTGVVTSLGRRSAGCTRPLLGRARSSRPSTQTRVCATSRRNL